MRYSHEYEGYVYIAGPAGFVIDRCGGSAEHLAAPAALGEDRRHCRHLLADAFGPLLGRRGKLKITIEFDESK